MKAPVLTVTLEKGEKKYGKRYILDTSPEGKIREKEFQKTMKGVEFGARNVLEKMEYLSEGD